MMDNDRTKPHDTALVPPAGCVTATARARREITSAELLAGEREIHIRHADETYTLRQTSKGKLILTK
jgi:hemin uptake protein HemP